MNHDFDDRAQPSTLAQPDRPSVTTCLICHNMLLRTGVSRILDGTRFAVAMGEFEGLGAPDLILLCDSPSQEGSAVMIRQLKERHPGARLVALSDNLDPWAVQELCTAGLDGLCPTGMSQAALRKVLDLVMLGEKYLPASVSLALLGQTSTSKPPTSTLVNGPARLAGKFSEREAQILQCLMKGASNKLIARELGIAEATVKVHIKAILRKMKAANRTQAAMWATQHLGLGTHSPDLNLAR